MNQFRSHFPISSFPGVGIDPPLKKRAMVLSTLLYRGRVGCLVGTDHGCYRLVKRMSVMKFVQYDHLVIRMSYNV